MRPKPQLSHGDAELHGDVGQPGIIAARPYQAVNPLAQTLDRIIFYALLTMTVLAAVPYGSVEPWWDALFQCFVFGLTILWALRGLLVGVFPINGKSLLPPLLAIVALIFIQTLPLWGGGTAEEFGGRQAISADPHETRRLAYKVFALVLFVGLMLTFTTTPLRLRSLARAVIGIASASAVFGLLHQALGYVGIVLLPSVLDSSYAQFINRNHFAYLMEMGFGLTIGLIIGGGVRQKRIRIYIAAATVMLIALLMSGSHGGLLSLICQIFFFALLFGVVRLPDKPEPDRVPTRFAALTERLHGSATTRLALAAALLLTIAAGTIFIGGTPVVGHIRAAADELNVGAEVVAKTRRIDMWRASLSLIKDAPLLGNGFGAYWVAIPEYHRATGNHTLYQAHNDYLELVASGGIVAFALSAWFVFVVVKQSRRVLNESADPFRRALCYGGLAGLFAVSVHSIVDFGLHITANALVFIALVVIAVARIPNAQDHGDTTGQTFDSVKG